MRSPNKGEVGGSSPSTHIGNVDDRQVRFDDFIKLVHEFCEGDDMRVRLPPFPYIAPSPNGKA